MTAVVLLVLGGIGFARFIYTYYVLHQPEEAYQYGATTLLFAAMGGGSRGLACWLRKRTFTGEDWYVDLVRYTKRKNVDHTRKAAIGLTESDAPDYLRAAGYLSLYTVTDDEFNRPAALELLKESQSKPLRVDVGVHLARLLVDSGCPRQALDILLVLDEGPGDFAFERNDVRITALVNSGRPDDAARVCDTLQSMTAPPIYDLPTVVREHRARIRAAHAEVKWADSSTEVLNDNQIAQLRKNCSTDANADELRFLYRSYEAWENGVFDDLEQQHRPPGPDLEARIRAFFKLDVYGDVLRECFSVREPERTELLAIFASQFLLTDRCFYLRNAETNTISAFDLGLIREYSEKGIANKTVMISCQDGSRAEFAVNLSPKPEMVFLLQDKLKRRQSCL